MCLSLPVAANLPLEHEAQRLLLATESAVEEGRWEAATDYMNRLAGKDNVQLPPEFYYLRGRILQEAGQVRAARQAYESYVKETGRDGEMYREALRRITQMEEEGAAGRTSDDTESSASIEPAAGGEIEQLQALYLADNPVDALIEHVNSLLTLHAWEGRSRTIVRQPNRGVQYRISVDGSNLQVRTRAYDSEGQLRVSMERLNVFGVNPMVTSRCFPEQAACWITDPRDNSHWLKLAENREGARETARMMGLLLRHLQQGR